MDSSSRTMDTARAAAVLGVSPRTLEADRQRGGLGVPYVKAGRRVVYLARDLEQWTTEHRERPRSGADVAAGR